MNGARWARACFTLVLVLLSLFTSARGWADEPELPKVDNRARAQRLFDEALAAAEKGDFASACPKFLASQQADPKTSTLLNLANCYEKNLQSASAWGAFREAEGLARKIGRTDWETIARDRAALLEPKLMKLTIVVPQESRLEGLAVTRDGEKISVGEYGVAIPVDPGLHIVGATADNRKHWTTPVTLTDGSASVTVPVLELVPETSGPLLPPPKERDPEPKPPPRTWSTWKTAGVAVAGAGVVALVIGTALAVTAKGDYDDARVRCADGARACPPDAVADSESAYGLATGATVSFVLGGLLVAGGAALYFLAPTTAASSPNARLPKSLPLLLPSGIGARW